MGWRVRVPPRSPTTSSSYWNIWEVCFPILTLGSDWEAAMCRSMQLLVERRIATRAKLARPNPSGSATSAPAQGRDQAPTSQAHQLSGSSAMFEPPHPILPLPSWQESSTVICSDDAPRCKPQPPTSKPSIPSSGVRSSMGRRRVDGAARCWSSPARDPEKPTPSPIGSPI
jgi:hypothetical protein